MLSLIWGPFATRTEWCLPPEWTPGWVNIISLRVLCMATCRSSGGKMQLVCLWYYVSLWIWGPWTTKIKFFFLSTPNLADASIIAEQMFSLENLFPIPYDEESPSENKQMYICVSASKTKPSISDERQQMLCAWGKQILGSLEVTQGFVFKCRF